MKMLIVVGVILLFLGSSIPLIASQPLQGKHIITVDDEPGDADYTSIRGALTNASSGDIIEVYSGIYTEYNLTMDKTQVSLIGIARELGSGNDSGKPEINNPSHHKFTLVVKADNISICGMKFIAEAPVWVTQIYIFPVHHFIFSNNHANIPDGENNLSNIFFVEDASDVVVVNNTFEHGNSQVQIFGSPNCLIINNTLLHARMDGFVLGRDNNTIVSGNLIDHAGEIALGFGGSDYHVMNNRIVNNGVGIALMEGSHVLVDHNELRNNSMAVEVEETNGLFARITKNNFIHNSINAFLLVCPMLSSNLIFWHNYYSRPHLLPKPFLGVFILLIASGEVPLGIPIPWFCFDWHPARSPYDIPNG